MDTSIQRQDNKSLRGLSWWNIYFILKIALFTQGSIDFHPLENIAFLAFLLMPIRYDLLHYLRNLVAVPVAIWLLHYDSYLPPISRLWAQIDQLMAFELEYLVELLGRFISTQALLAIFVLFVAYQILNRFLKVSVLVTLAVFTVSAPILYSENMPVEQTSVRVESAKEQVPNKNISEINDTNLTSYRNNFFNSEAKRTVDFSTSEQGAPFDLLFLSLCSIAWDDIELAGQQDHPIFSEFDILFDNYNSATSYSGPAVIRLLRAGCGQEEHFHIYEEPSSKACYLFENLKKLGFKENIIMNHDGI